MKRVFWKNTLSINVNSLGKWIMLLTLGLILQVFLSSKAISNPKDASFISKGNPHIEFIFIPSYGSSDDLIGRVRNANPNDYKVAVYIFVEGAGWWTKPTFAQPLTQIQFDSTWTTDITTGGSDIYATRIHAFLLPNDINPPISAGLPCLPTSLDTLSVTNVYTERSSRTISFSGYEWRVKASVGKVGPGPNYFSDSNKNVWVDDQDQLHIKISNRNGIWYCGEVVLNESLGYGRYIFKLGSRIGQVNENAVLGLFTWDNNASNEFYREIDVEFSRWGVVNDPNAQYVVQPWDYSGNLLKWIQPPSLDSSTHCFEWRPDSICFLSVKGHQTSAPYDSIIHSWKYTGPNIPTSGGENARINLWLFRGQPPTDSSEVEVIISNFEYEELSSFVNMKSEGKPTRYSLSQNYPNPFNPYTTVRFNIPKTSHVTIKIYDVLGHEIRTLVENDFRSGYYTATWDGRDESYLPVPSGLYLMRMLADEFISVKKLTLLR